MGEVSPTQLTYQENERDDCLGSFFFFLIFIVIYLLYRSVSLSTVKQSESATHIYIYKPSFFRLHSHSGHQRVLSRVPCAEQEVLLSYLVYAECS